MADRAQGARPSGERAHRGNSWWHAMQAPGTRPAGPSRQTRRMSDGMSAESEQQTQVVVVGPDGRAVEGGGAGENAEDRERPVTEMVEQPAKVMRIGSMIRQLLEEVRAAPLDEQSRVRLKEIHQSSIKELEEGLAPELVKELERLSLPFDEGSTPSEAELRVAQ